ncbi:MAG TPA: ABC transporter permease, partial [Microlunatus sp.]|nr:ABC transporter permease [Microlunatus sp.]
SPTSPVESQISLITSSGSSIDPEAIQHLRESLTEMYGLSGSPLEQYLAFWGRLFRGDLGPSLSSFPTPVAELVGRALPWTLSIVLAATLLSWVLGNLFGVLASYYPRKRLLGVVDVASQAVRPIPYYVVAIVLLVVFAYVLPLFPFSGAYQTGARPELSVGFVLDYLWHATLPAATLVLVGFGGWFVGMKALTSNVISEDYVVYAETAGIAPRRVLTHYVTRNAMLPQVTGLAMDLGTVFSGALIMEVVFGYPGVGLLSLQAVFRNDYSLMMGITLYSIIGVATAVFVIDLIYPLLDPRVRYQ